jgi:hypothetical protein
MKIIGTYDFHSLIVLNIVNMQQIPVPSEQRLHSDKLPFSSNLLEDATEFAGETQLQYAMTRTTVAGDLWGLHILIPRDQESPWSRASLSLPKHLDISPSTPTAGFYGGLHCPKIELVVGENGFYWIQLD